MSKTKKCKSFYYPKFLHLGYWLNELHGKKFWLVSAQIIIFIESNSSGAILEISLRVGVIPFTVTSVTCYCTSVTSVTSGRVLLTIFVSFYLQRLQKPLQVALSEVFCTKLRLIHHVKLV